MLLPPLRHLGKVNASRGILHNQARALASSVPPRARVAAGNVRVHDVSLSPSLLPLTKTFPYFVLSGFRCCYASLQARGAPATPRDRTPVVVAACGVEAAPPAASSDSSRSSTGVTGYVTGLGAAF